MALDDLARTAGMCPSKAHRYLVSLQRVGAMLQDPLTGRYELDSFALRLDLVSPSHSDVIARTWSLLAGLWNQIGHAIGIAVWSDRSLTVVHWEKAGGTPGVNPRTGDVLSMLNSTTGQLFGAYQSMEQTLPLVEREPYERAGDDLPGLPRSLTDYYRLCGDVRTESASWVLGSLLPDVNVLLLPVFGAHGQLVLVLITLNLQPPFYAQRGGELERTLRTFAMRLSAILQAPVEHPTKAGSRRGRTVH